MALLVAPAAALVLLLTLVGSPSAPPSPGGPRTTLPEGVGRAEWQPETPVTAAQTTFVASVFESACNSGQPATGRVAEPAIIVARDAITITFGVWPPAGSQDCPSNPATPTTVTLPEPLGRRALLDGSFDPPRVVQDPPPTPGPGSSPGAALPWIVATASVADAHLGATLAIADSFQEGIRMVRVRIVKDMTLDLRLDALEDVVFDAPLTLCLVGPYAAPDDAGLESPCWGAPDLSAVVMGALPTDAFGRPTLRAGQPLETTVSLLRGDARCDYAPGEWRLELAVGRQQLGQVQVGVPWDPELPLPLYERSDSRYCGLANSVLSNQGEPPTPAP